jgi:hypothetical protein
MLRKRPERRVNGLWSVGTFVGTICRQTPEFVLIRSQFVAVPPSPKMQKAPYYRGFYWSEREDLNLRPLVSQS